MNEENTRHIIHFIRCGSSDSILLEAYGHYGLIDSSNPYKDIEKEVEHVQIDISKKEIDQSLDDPDKSVKAVINYLNYLKVDKLDFIIGTHAHSDHIGGIPAIAYYFVDNNTKYYYKGYRETIEDTIRKNWANYKYYLAAINSMKTKSAQMIDITNKKITFDLGEFHIELLNTDVDPNEKKEKLTENKNSIVTLIQFRNTKILLTADMTVEIEQKIKDFIGKIDILKLSHHGYSESSYEFLKVVQPKYVIILNDIIPHYSYSIINYLKDNYNTKIYLTGNISKSSQSIENSAIKLIFKKDGTEYEFINTGNEVELDKSLSGWLRWCDKWTYIGSGKTVKELKFLNWSKGQDWFYFNKDGIMLTGWQELERTGGKKNFYFEPKYGYMIRSCSINIEGKNYTFDKDGCLIE
jgi:beta-lactamase superfamily II metal-dependent hydrolase